MMQRIRHLLMKFTPEFILVAARKLIKQSRRKSLSAQAAKGSGLTAAQLLEQLQKAGIQKGDLLLVHCSLSKIGFIEGGSPTIVKALLEAVGSNGTILMPAFPAAGRNLDYLSGNPLFDIKNTPSKMGAVSEYFRTLPGTYRSIHPTDSVCANGKDARWLTEGHKNRLHPHDEFSPFRRLCEKNGKILMLGTTLNGACTNLHTLEDAFSDFLYPVYLNRTFEVEVMDDQGQKLLVSTLVHNPEWSAKRNADALKPMFMREGVLTEFKIGKANSLLIDANRMLEVMKSAYLQHGVTMYTPEGGPLPVNV